MVNFFVWYKVILLIGEFNIILSIKGLSVFWIFFFIIVLVFVINYIVLEINVIKI